MAKHIILPSRLNKNTCRHGDLYYLDKSTSEFGIRSMGKKFMSS